MVRNIATYYFNVSVERKSVRKDAASDFFLKGQ
jgi:hypothetical protein